MCCGGPKASTSSPWAAALDVAEKKSDLMLSADINDPTVIPEEHTGSTIGGGESVSFQRGGGYGSTADF
jgi:hypothetical protein